MVASNSNNKPRTRAGDNGFFFPNDIPMDRVHFLDQSTNAFLGVKDGLPELIKNSKDQYARLGVMERPLRQIVVIADTEEHSLAVLDFAGAEADEFKGWANWADRHANRRDLSMEIEGGHGNGGKSFMVRGATERSFIESCFEGKRTKMGFQNDDSDAKYKPGWANERGVKISGIAETDPRSRLKDFLEQIDLTLGDLPPQVVKAFDQRQSFTGVLLLGLTDWANRRSKTLSRMSETIPGVIASHGQTAMTIETCDVWVIVDGKLATRDPIAPAKIEPFPNFEQPLEFEIPNKLQDADGEWVDMTGGPSGPRVLRLHTSARQMQLSEDMKARNVIRLWNDRNNVATWPLQALGVHFSSVGFIFGELRLPALSGEHLSGIERGHLNQTPMTRALETWAKGKIKTLAEELHKAMIVESKPQERKQARNALEGIRDLMRKYLNAEQAGIETSTGDNGGHGGSGKGTTYRKRPTEYGTRLDEIILESGREQIVLALGTTVPLGYSCVEKQADGSTKPVRLNGLSVKSDKSGHVIGDSKVNLTAQGSGECEIWLESDNGVISNHVKCVVVEATDVTIDQPEEPLLQGQRLKLALTFTTAAGPRTDVLIDGSVDEPGMGQIGRGGRFVAGGREGTATIRIRFGKESHDQQAFPLQIGPDRVTPPDDNGGRGSDIPEILLCGESAPGKEELPEDQRTMPGGEAMPTIIEDAALFPNIVWINPNSKEAIRVRSQRGGSSGRGSISSSTFIQFLALKCFDILKRLYVRQDFQGKPMTEFQYIVSVAQAEMDCVGFIDAAWELTDSLVKKAAEESSGVQV